ncbi:MAG: biotin--protein ligase [Desulfovibrionaceae bacterium]|nr:biotin--protein ligase [Desulfovibrionaceae bacterium]
MSSIWVLWDDSHLWGLLILRALRSWDRPHRLVRANEIAQGVSAGNPGGPSLLLVPGGQASAKAHLLGAKGRKAVQDFVASGGAYLGLCGGAGLALSGGRGLDLCPWGRAKFADRLGHFLSGHIHVDLAQGHPLVPAALGSSALVPVWWPGQFASDNGPVEVLAKYRRPGPDFWVADLILKRLSEDLLREWESVYGVHIKPDFLLGRPCVISGAHGQGTYVLSYSHLETPASPQANAWLAHILGALTGSDSARPPVPAWDLSTSPIQWTDPALNAARGALEEAIDTGQEHLLLFWRNPWLLGWRRGIPGAAINSLYALVCESQALGDEESAGRFWRQRAAEFSELMGRFCEGLTHYLLAERLSMTVFRTKPASSDFSKSLKKQRDDLFGPPPGSGGAHGRILGILEELFRLLYPAR